MFHYAVHSSTAYNNANLTGLSQLNPSLSNLSGNLNHLSSSASNGPLASLNNTNGAASSNYLERSAIVKCGSPANSSLNGCSSSTSHSPNGSPSSGHLLNSSTYANGLCNAQSAYPAGYLSAMGYYNGGCSATYQELTNSYHNLQSPDHQTIMVSSSGSPSSTSYSNLISLNSGLNSGLNGGLNSGLNGSTAAGNQSPICNSNSQCLVTAGEPATLTTTASSNHISSTTPVSSSVFTIKRSNSPVPSDLSSPNANLSSSSCSSSSSSLSLSSYCERNTPLRSYRTAPYPKTAAAGRVALIRIALFFTALCAYWMSPGHSNHFDPNVQSPVVLDSRISKPPNCRPIDILNSNPFDKLTRIRQLIRLTLVQTL